MSINALWQKKSLLQSFCIKQHDIIPIVKRAEVELLIGGDQKGLQQQFLSLLCNHNDIARIILHRSGSHPQAPGLMNAES